MSDETTAPAQSAVVANAQQALAIKDLSTDVSHLKKQVKALWITVVIVAVIVVVLGGFTLVGRLFGARTFGAGGFRGGTLNGQQFNGGTGTGGGTTQQAPQTTTPGQ
jgi:hypothetical protein